MSELFPSIIIEAFIDSGYSSDDIEDNDISNIEDNEDFYDSDDGKYEFTLSLSIKTINPEFSIDYPTFIKAITEFNETLRDIIASNATLFPTFDYFTYEFTTASKERVCRDLTVRDSSGYQYIKCPTYTFKNFYIKEHLEYMQKNHELFSRIKTIIVHIPFNFKKSYKNTNRLVQFMYYKIPRYLQQDFSYGKSGNKFPGLYAAALHNNENNKYLSKTASALQSPDAISKHTGGFQKVVMGSVSKDEKPDIKINNIDYVNNLAKLIFGSTVGKLCEIVETDDKYIIKTRNRKNMYMPDDLDKKYDDIVNIIGKPVYFEINGGLTFTLFKYDDRHVYKERIENRNFLLNRCTYINTFVFNINNADIKKLIKDKLDMSTVERIDTIEVTYLSPNTEEDARKLLVLPKSVGTLDIQKVTKTRF